MKSRLLSLLFLALSLACSNQTSESSYDAELAQRLGADEMGMKNYTLVILKTGPAVIEDKALRDSLFAGHFSNIFKLAEAKKLVLAGPLGKNEHAYRGIFILDTTDEQEIKELLAGDPTIVNGIFEVELINWYGSAALPEYLEADKKIRKTSF